MTARSQSQAVRFGVQSGQQMGEWPPMLDLWRKADDWGYDSLWNPGGRGAGIRGGGDPGGALGLSGSADFFPHGLVRS
jgi:hypothetical protein